MEESRVVGLDERLFYIINGMAKQSESLDWVMSQLSQEGNLLLPIVLLIGYWAWIKWPEARIAAPALGIVIILSDFFGGQLKQLIGRARPCQVLTQINALHGCGGSFSMPSNHAVNSATAAAFLFMLYPSTGWITWPLVGLIGISRVYLGDHYVSDVVVGWVLGGAFGAGVGWCLLNWPQFGRVKRGNSTHFQEGSKV